MKGIRFIAGAICPSCKLLDRIALTADDKKIYCTNCSFEELKPQIKTTSLDLEKDSLKL